MYLSLLMNTVLLEALLIQTLMALPCFMLTTTCYSKLVFVECYTVQLATFAAPIIIIISRDLFYILFWFYLVLVLK